MLEAIKRTGIACIRLGRAEGRPRDRAEGHQAVRVCPVYASVALKDDREIVLEAIKQYGYTLKYASAALQDDREFVRRPSSRTGLRWDTPWPRCRTTARSCWRPSGNGGAVLPGALKDDREIVLEAIKHTGIPGIRLGCAEGRPRDRAGGHQADRDCLRYASAALKDDREIVLEAIKQYGYALKYAWAAAGRPRDRADRQAG